MFSGLFSKRMGGTARNLAAALTRSHGRAATALCREALNHPELTGQRRDMTRMALSILEQRG